LKQDNGRLTVIYCLLEFLKRRVILYGGEDTQVIKITGDRTWFGTVLERSVMGGEESEGVEGRRAGGYKDRWRRRGKRTRRRAREGDIPGKT
jgi:hypothetical protein